MKMMYKTFCIGAGVALLSTSLWVSAETVYRWVDENGQVHFSQQPSEKHQSEPIQTQKTRAFGQSKFDSEEEPVTATVQAKPQEQKEEEKQDQASPELQKSAELCKKAQENKTILTGKLRVRQDGRIITEDERQQQLQYMDEVIKNNC